MDTDFLYVSDWTHMRLYQVSLTGGTMTAVDFPLAVGPVGVLFNVRSRRIMWTDAHLYTVWAWMALNMKWWQI